MQIFFEFLYGNVWGNMGKNPSNPQKFACSYTYVDGCLLLAVKSLYSFLDVCVGVGGVKSYLLTVGVGL